LAKKSASSKNKETKIKSAERAQEKKGPMGEKKQSNKEGHMRILLSRKQEKEGKN